MERDNFSLSRHPRLYLWFTLAFSAVLSLPIAGVAQGPGTENGQWTYLGGDAWHTRYTPADQINASNFESLEVAWMWDAASLTGASVETPAWSCSSGFTSVPSPRRHCRHLLHASTSSPSMCHLFLFVTLSPGSRSYLHRRVTS